MAFPHRLLFVVSVASIALLLALVTVLLPGDRTSIDFRPSSFNWSALPQRHPVAQIRPLPPGSPVALRAVQYDFPQAIPDLGIRQRQDCVRAEFVRNWDSYKRYAWGYDELLPVSAGGKTSLGGWAATMIDSLDTLWIMGLRDEFREAAAYVAQLDWANTTASGLNVFETTIRHLGGLLSAYDLSGEPALLSKAVELGDMLYVAFDTPNRLPVFWLDFGTALNGTLAAGADDPAAGPTSLSLEFTRLAQLTGQSRYFDAVDRVTVFLARTQLGTTLPGLWPQTIDFETEDVGVDDTFSLGAMSDSIYEYLPKMYALLGGLDEKYGQLYRTAMSAAEEHLLFRPMLPGGQPADVLFSGNAVVNGDSVDRNFQVQHLSCFAGGMFGLGGKLFDVPHHVDIGDRLARGCAWAYGSFTTGIMPEISTLLPCPSANVSCRWDETLWRQHRADQSLGPGFVSVQDPRYLLRPEAIESVFLLYRMTGAQDLQDMAWHMFQAVVNATETSFANSAIADVTATGATAKTDYMESFWLAETLKYFYLIFSPPALVSLDEYVFNTEAHPFKRPKGPSNP